MYLLLIMSLLSNLYGNVSKENEKSDNKKLSILSRAIMHGGNTSDAASTIYALKNPNVIEANPIWGQRPSNLKVAAIKSAGSIVEDILLSKLAKHKPKLANGLAKGIGIGMMMVAANNIHQSKRNGNK